MSGDQADDKTSHETKRELPPRDSLMVRIPLPGGRVARVPLTLLESYVSEDVELAHDPNPADVTAHHQTIDSATGTNQWHTDVELGPCEWVDANGFHRSEVAHHYHPYGTDYTEVI